MKETEGVEGASDEGRCEEEEEVEMKESRGERLEQRGERVVGSEYQRVCVWGGQSKH